MVHARPNGAAAVLAMMAFLPLASSIAPAQVSGLFTVNAAAPAGNGNFVDLSSAVAMLLAQGVSGPVTFELFDDGGPFTDAMPFTTTNVTWGTSDAVLTLGSWTGASPANRVTFRAAAGEFPVLDATGRAMGVFFNGADHVTLEGLEIRGADYDAISLYSEAAHGQILDARIARCRLHDCGGAGVVVYGNLPAPQNTRIENCFLWNLQTTNIGGFTTLARFAYINTRRSNGTVILHNSFFVGTGVGQFFSVIGSFPGSYTDTPIAELSGNVVHKTAAPTAPILRFIEIGGVGSVPVNANDNCWHHPVGGPLAVTGNAGSTTIPDLAAWQIVSGLDGTSIGDDPRYAAPMAGDLHLLPTSPCVDAGPDPALLADDIDGQQRTTADMGADELGSANVPSVLITGASNAHSSGLLPSLGTNQLPALGTSSFSIEVSGAPPGASVLLFWADATITTPIQLGFGNLIWLEPTSLLSYLGAGTSPAGPLTVAPNGLAALTFAIGTDPTLAGFTFAAQATVTDAQNGAGFVSTNAIRLVLN